MLVLLPPSETKAVGGDGAPLDLEQLSFPELTSTRARLGACVERLARNPKRAAEVLGLGRTQAHELEHNVELLRSPTMPAIERYTGVLYDSLDVQGLRPAERVRADQRLAIGSALFGVVRATDPIPAYRLSGCTKLPRVGTLAGVWKPRLGPVLAQVADRELVVDLRSGAYQALAPVPQALTVRVLTERADGSRSIVSHFNKAWKGKLARLLATAPRECSSVADVLRVARRGGLDVEQVGELAIDLITRD